MKIYFSLILCLNVVTNEKDRQGQLLQRRFNLSVPLDLDGSNQTFFLELITVGEFMCFRVCWLRKSIRKTYQIYFCWVEGPKVNKIFIFLHFFPSVLFVILKFEIFFITILHYFFQNCWSTPYYTLMSNSQRCMLTTYSQSDEGREARHILKSECDRECDTLILCGIYIKMV